VRFLHRDVFHLRIRKSERREYITKQGDTLASIASETETDPKDLLDLNNWEELELLPGQRLMVPHVENGVRYFEEIESEDGDRFASIAARAGTGAEALFKANDLMRLRLQENQVLKIPERRVHEVREGETLEGILEVYGIGYEEFIKANLKNWLKPGSKVFIE